MNLTALGVNREDIVIVLDELDFMFYREQADEAVALWEQGTPFPDMVDKLRPKVCNTGFYISRDHREAEVFLLLLHLSLEGRIDYRPGAIWGCIENQREGEGCKRIKT